MPSAPRKLLAPRKPCLKPGCNVLVGNGSYCDAHKIEKKQVEVNQRIQYDKERGTSASRGYNYRWSKASKKYREDNPLCIMCEAKGIVKINNCVDHKIPVNSPDDPLFWEESNWQGLCTSCHSEKTAKEDGALGNRKVERFI
jgi:5-methylcytosine-specific restriction protein A